MGIAVRKPEAMAGLESAMGVREIMEILPHRYPFLLVDRVLELEPGKRIVAVKNVTANEPHFVGHWPGNPVMPGALILEAMAQAGAIMLLSAPEDRGKLPFLAGACEVRWRRQVKPGDQLVIEVELTRRKGDVGRASAVAKVNGEVACEGIFTFVLEATAEKPAQVSASPSRQPVGVPGLGVFDPDGEHAVYAG